MLFWLTMWTGKKEQNRLLQANAWHHRSDALSSVAALIGIRGAQLGYTFLDPLAIGCICADYENCLGHG